MTPPNFMVIGLQIGKLHGGGGGQILKSRPVEGTKAPDIIQAKCVNVQVSSIGSSKIKKVGQ